MSKKKTTLDKEEQGIVNSYERADWRVLEDDEKKKAVKMLQDSARHTLKKSKSISIRLTPTDYAGIRAKAIKEGIPYQTLISSIIHRYAHDK